MRLVTRLAAFILAVPFFASPAAAQPPAPYTFPDDRATPLPEAVRRIAERVPDEGTPRPDEHYPVSNEHRHDLWFPHVRDLGGAFVGVGADQCYTLAAMQNAEILWLVDYDPLVPMVHRMYGVLIPASDTPAALVARFSPEQADATEALLREALAADPEVGQLVGSYRRSRQRMHRYLGRALRNVRNGVAATWLSDPMLYERVRALHRGGRVIARNGDVTANGALRAVGAASRALGLPVRVLYFSNAEQFFPFNAEFRENLDALLTDDRSVVLRTFREPGVPNAQLDEWHYMVQPVEDMRGRLGEGGYRHSREIVFDLTSSRRQIGAGGLSVVDASVPRRQGTYARARRQGGPR